MLALLLPTVSATAADAELVKLSVPEPVSPPNVAAVSDPKLKVPLPLVSSVLFCKASELPRSERAAADQGIAAVGIGSGQGQRAAIDLGQAAGAGKRSRKVSRRSRPYRRSLRRRWCPASWARWWKTPLA